MEQLNLQCNELVSQNQQLVQVIDDACQSVQELPIPADIPTEAHIHRLAARVHEVQNEITKVKLELNLRITKLWLKVQPSTPLQVRKQRASAIIVGPKKIGMQCETVATCWKNHLRSSQISRRTPTSSSQRYMCQNSNSSMKTSEELLRRWSSFRGSRGCNMLKCLKSKWTQHDTRKQS